MYINEIQNTPICDSRSSESEYFSKLNRKKKRINISESSNENIPSISKIKKKKYKRKKCKFILDEAVVSNDSFNSDSDNDIVDSYDLEDTFINDITSESGTESNNSDLEDIYCEIITS